MKKRIVTAGIIVALTCVPFHASAKTDTIKFRGLEWGTPLEEVMEKQLEGKTKDVDYGFADESNSLLVVNETVSGLDTIISYEFTEDWKLCGGMYLLQEEHVNDNMYYDDFCTLEEKISSKYGQPDKSIDNWRDDLYKDDPDDIGMALGAEHLTLYRAWIADDGSNIIMQCYGKNFKISTNIFYTPSEDLNLEPYSSKDTSDEL